MVEIFFGIITRPAIRPGTLTTVKDLISTVSACAWHLGSDFVSLRQGHFWFSLHSASWVTASQAHRVL